METLSGKRVEVRVGGRSRDEEFVAFVEADGPYLFRTAFFLVGERALGSLSPQQRRVVVLRHVLDLPEAQVAPTVRSAPPLSRCARSSLWSCTVRSVCRCGTPSRLRHTVGSWRRST